METGKNRGTEQNKSFVKEETVWAGFFQRAINRVLEYQKEHPLKVGATVAHHSDKYNYRLDHVAGKSVLVSRKDLETGQVVSNIFPLAETFDFYLVLTEAFKLHEEYLSGLGHGTHHGAIENIEP